MFRVEYNTSVDIPERLVFFINLDPPRANYLLQTILLPLFPHQFLFACHSKLCSPYQRHLPDLHIHDMFQYQSPNLLISHGSSIHARLTYSVHTLCQTVNAREG